LSPPISAVGSRRALSARTPPSPGDTRTFARTPTAPPRDRRKRIHRAEQAGALRPGRRWRAGVPGCGCWPGVGHAGRRQGGGGMPRKPRRHDRGSLARPVDRPVPATRLEWVHGDLTTLAVDGDGSCTAQGIEQIRGKRPRPECRDSEPEWPREAVGEPIAYSATPSSRPGGISARRTGGCLRPPRTDGSVGRSSVAAAQDPR